MEDDDDIFPSTKEPKVGLLDRKTVNSFLFYLVSTCIGISVFIIVLAIWDYVGNDFSYKTISTLATFVGGGFLFSGANDFFGKKAQ